MKKLILLFFFITLTHPAFATQYGMLHPTKLDHKERIIKALFGIAHAPKLFTYVTVVQDGTGRELLKFSHWNDTSDAHTINFIVVCNSDGKTGKAHQRIDNSWFGPIKIIQYFTFDCHENDIGVKFIPRGIWNNIDVASKIVGTKYGSYRW